jgi:hypothetical protein
MNETELNNKVLNKIKEFESIDEIQPSSDWNQSLMEKIGSTKQYSRENFTIAKYSFMIILFILINLGFIIKMMNKDIQPSIERGQELQKISKEFLINPNSINNQ